MKNVKRYHKDLASVFQRLENLFMKWVSLQEEKMKMGILALNPC